MPGYLGNDPAGSATKIARQTYTTSGAATTDFTFTSGYDVGYLDVYVNGERQTKGKNFTASDGSTFKVLNGGVGTGSTVEAIAYKTFNLATVDFDDLGNTGNLTLSGDVSAVNGTFSGDVSIGGTLTYEDVTNIDSVGIITANAGIDISNTIVANNDSTIRYDNDTFHIKVDANNVRGSSTFKLDIDDTNAITIDDNRRIGIGTNNPGDVLTIAGTDAFIKVDRSNGNPGIDFRFNGSTTNRGLIDVNSTGDLRLSAGGNTERLRITADGDVGIGTTIPGGKLQIDGGELLVGTKTVKAVASTTNATAIFRDDGGAHTIIAVESNATSGGGTLALSASRNTTDNGFTILQDNDVLGEVRFAGDDGTNLQHSGARIRAEVDGTPAEDSMPGALTFLTNPGGALTEERLRITAAGDVGIGTATVRNSLKLDVEGAIGAGDGTTSNVSFANFDDPNSGMYFPAADQVGLVVGGSRKLLINSSGLTLNNGDLTLNNNDILGTGGINITGIVTATQLFEGTTRVATTGKAIAMAMLFG